MITRRKFLFSGPALAAGALLAEVAKADVPIVFKRGTQVGKTFPWMIVPKFEPPSGAYYAFIHPDVEHDLRQLSARHEWHHAYQQWRAAGRPGSDSPREILARFKDSGLMFGELGGIVGMKMRAA